MKVKICGIKDIETAKIAIEAGADAIGFVFAESKREINMDEAKRIASSLPDHILKIGVFVDESKEVLESIFEEVGLTHLQLHGDESPEFCRSLKYPVIKALRMETEMDVEKLTQYDCEYLLLDSPYGKFRGGNGTTFNWNLLSNHDINRKKLILAGGLKIDNVVDAVRLIKPIMVDVSSGVETESVKDKEKIESFIKKVKVGGN